MAIELVEFFQSPVKKKWISQISSGNTEACKYLGELLQGDKLKTLCGPSTKLFMLTENGTIYSFCTLAEQDEVNAPEMTPWIGFVYTFPKYRGHYFAMTLIEIVCDYAKEHGVKEIFISPPADTRELYEKFGFVKLNYLMPSIYGYETFVYKKKLV